MYMLVVVLIFGGLFWVFYQIRKQFFYHKDYRKLNNNWLNIKTYLND